MSTAGRVKLNCSDSKVTITGSDRSTAHVKIDRVTSSKGVVFGRDNDFHVEVSESNGDLTIDEVGHYSMSGIIGYYREEYTIQIELPRTAGVSIRGDDGDFSIKNVDGNIALNLDDADIVLEGCDGDDTFISLDDGDLTMDRGMGRMEIDADDADIRISQARFTSFTAEIDDGDLEIETTLLDNSDYKIIAQDGLLAITVLGGGGTFDLRHDDARLTTEGNFQTMTSSEEKTTLRLPGGMANMSIRADDARVRLVTK